MRRSISTIIFAVPLALALTWGASAASADEPDWPAPVPWAPFEQEQPDDDNPGADVPWAPFEQDEVDPDLPEGQPEPDGGDVDPGPEVEPEPETEMEPDPQAAPVVEPRPIDSGTGKAAQETVDDTAIGSEARATDSPLVVGLMVTGMLLAGLSVAAAIAALTFQRRRAAHRG
jgi:hypothetical protein